MQVMILVLCFNFVNPRSVIFKLLLAEYVHCLQMDYIFFILFGYQNLKGKNYQTDDLVKVGIYKNYKVISKASEKCCKQTLYLDPLLHICDKYHNMPVSPVDKTVWIQIRPEFLAYLIWSNLLHT